MPTTIHISDELRSLINDHKHPGQSCNGFLLEILRKRYNKYNRDKKGQFASDPPKEVRKHGKRKKTK